MKIFVITFTLTFLFLASFADAAETEVQLLDCQVKEVLDSTVLEESLSKYEYPNLSATYNKSTGDYIVDIGVSFYESSDESVISFTSTSEGSEGMANGAELTIKDQDGTIFRLVHTVTASYSDAVLYTNLEKDNPTEVATFACAFVKKDFSN